MVAELKQMKLKVAADKLEKGIEETFTYMDFPYEHWLKKRYMNMKHLENYSTEKTESEDLVG